MKPIGHTLRRSLCIGAGSLALLLAGCGGAMMMANKGVHVDLGGSQEVPAVAVDGIGSGTILVADDGAVSGSITTDGVEGIAAHIHMGAIGHNGPVIVPLQKTAPNVWSVPEGAKLTEAQMAAYRKGDLYVNVHTVAHRGGEVRGQIIP
ncbi:MAG TPA: CHRD domain-containing protein [Burkholderiales bacterium]|nr:CHRD domain-containing protein [Burkholderiales bacterium]